MKTHEEQQAFFDAHRGAIRDAARAAGAPAVVDYIGGRADPLERRVLYTFARGVLAFEAKTAEDLTAYADVCRAGIADILAQAAESPESRSRLTDTANVLSYNLAADLADCWPGDETPRIRSHFETGLAAGDDCVRWREELNKPPAPRSIAHWVRGMHRFSLGDEDGAAQDWSAALDYSRAAEKDDGRPAEVSSDATFSLILTAGYDALARWRRGDEGAREDYRRALAAFRDQLEDEACAGDARFGIEQLEKVRTNAPRATTTPM